MWASLESWLKSKDPSIRASLFVQRGKFYQPLGQEIKYDFANPVENLFIIIDDPPLATCDVIISVDSSTTKNEMKITRKTEKVYDPTNAIQIPIDMIVDRPLIRDTIVYISVKIMNNKSVVAHQGFNVTFENIGERSRRG